MYTASTRYLVAGSVVNMAIIQVIAPKLSELMTGGFRTRARDVYQVATSWLMMLAWPMYFALALFAPVLLRVFGHEYADGASALAVLAIAMLVATGIGPVDVVLLMGGRSLWNLFNVIVALALNIGISLVLIPKIGITGAAVAWAAAILFNNIAPLIEVRAFLKVDPFGRGFPAVAASAIVCFGGIGAAVRLTAGETLPAFIAYMVVASIVYAGAALGVPRAHGAAAAVGDRQRSLRSATLDLGSYSLRQLLRLRAGVMWADRVEQIEPMARGEDPARPRDSFMGHHVEHLRRCRCRRGHRPCGYPIHPPAAGSQPYGWHPAAPVAPCAGLPRCRRIP